MSSILDPSLERWLLSVPQRGKDEDDAHDQARVLQTPDASELRHAMLGAYVWSLGSLIRGYVANDISASTYYWTVFRFATAFVSARVAHVLIAPQLSELGALLLSSIPFAEVIRFVRVRLGETALLEPANLGVPKLTTLQGMDSDLEDDNQLLLIWNIWGVFEAKDDEETSARDAQPWQQLGAASA